MSTRYQLGTAPGRLSWLEHPWQLLRRPLSFLSSLRRVGDIVKIRFGPVWVFLIQNPEAVREVLVRSAVFDKGGPFFDKARILFGDGIGTCPHEVHRVQRRRMQPAFGHDRLPEQAAVMRAEVARTVGAWRSGQDLDIHAEMSALSLSVLIHTMFVTDAVAEQTAVVQRSMPVILRGLYRRMLAPVGLVERLPLPSNRRFEQVIGGVRAAVDHIIAMYRAAGIEHGDILASLLAARDEDTGAGMTDEEIRDQILTLIVGGTETTAAALTWTFYLLGEHPEVERRLHDEVDEILAGREAGIEDLPRLAYTQRVITEALRMYPPAWMFTRRTTREVEIGGHRIPGGTAILLCPYAINHDPELYPDPDRFDPDRWLSDRGQALLRGVMLPFGAGPRKCIAHNFALTEATIVVATVASRFVLRPIPGAKIRLVPRMALNPGALRMMVQRRRDLGASAQ